MSLGQQIASLYARIGADLSDLDSGLASMRKKMESATKSMASLGTKLSLGITLPVVGAGVAMTKLAMDAVESENLFTVSMGDMADSARQFSEQLRDQLGLNAYEVRRQVGTWQVMIENMGLGRDRAYEMSKGFTVLANDMASFYNMSPEQAFEKLQAGLSGEIEPLKRLGIVINETAVKSYAMERGFIKSGQQMSEAQKIAVRYALIMEQTAKAQGDMARTIDSPANQLRVIKARFTEAAIEAGQVFLPMVSGALLWITNRGMPAVTKAINDFKTSWTEMSDHAKMKVLLVAALFVGSGPLLQAVSVSIRGLGLLASAFGLLPRAAAIGVTGAGVLLVGFRDQMAGIAESVGNFMHDMGAGMVQAGGLAAKLGQPLMELGNRWYNNAQALKSKGLGGMIADEIVDVGSAAFDALADQAMGLTAMFDIPQSTAEYGKTASVMGDVLAPKVELTKDAFDALAGAVDDAGKKAKKVGPSMQDFTNSLVAMHPATKMAAAQVKHWNDRIQSVNLAIQANRDQTQAAQADYARMGERLSDLNNQLSEQQRRLSDLASPRLTGMGAMDETMAGIEQRLRVLKVSKLQGIGDIRAINQESAALEKQLELQRAIYDATYADPLRRAKLAAEGPQTEMTLDQVLTGISSTRARIAGLTGDITAQEGAMRSQKAMIDGLQAANDGLNRTLQEYQVQLQRAQTNQQLISEGLALAFSWMLQDRKAMQDMGAEGVTQSAIVDTATRKLLDAINEYAQGTKDTVSANLEAIVQSYQDALNRANAIMSRMPGMPSVNIPTEPAAESLPYAGSFGGGGVVPGPVGRPMLATVHGGEPIGNAGIDYDRLAAAIAKQPIRVEMDGRELARLIRPYTAGTVVL